METSQRIPAVIAYIPVIGWLFVLLTQNKNPFAIFHVRQAIGLILFLILAAIAWAAITWVMSWLPFGFLVGNVLFALVIACFYLRHHCVDHRHGQRRSWQDHVVARVWPPCCPFADWVVVIIFIPLPSGGG